MKEKNDDGTAELIMLFLAAMGVTIGVMAMLACAAKTLVK